MFAECLLWWHFQIVFVVAVVALCVTGLASAVGSENDGESMQTAETFGYIKRKLFGGAKAPSKKSSSSFSSLWGQYYLLSS